jgi:hypothetical protein
MVLCLPVAVSAQAPPVSVWGDLDLRGYFTGERVAPNGHVYEPLFSLTADLNIGRPDLAYVFVDSEFWGQKAAVGVTNQRSGSFDFSKREFDILGGVAVRPLVHWDVTQVEVRAFVYSLNNLNRGTDKENPSGFLDGGAVGARYYWGRSYVGAGYYPGGDLIGQARDKFTPGLYGEAGVYYDFWRKPEQASLFLEAQYISDAPVTAKLLNIQAGALLRPFRSFLNFEIRAGVESVYDFQAHEGRALPFLGIAVTW